MLCRRYRKRYCQNSSQTFDNRRYVITYDTCYAVSSQKRLTLSSVLKNVHAGVLSGISALIVAIVSFVVFALISYIINKRVGDSPLSESTERLADFSTHS